MPIFHKKTYITGVMILSSFLAMADDELDSLRVKKFHELNFQRSWYYAVKLIPSGSKDAQEEHARIMTSAAFHYWLMRQKGLIEEMAVYQNQIRKTFRDGQLSKDLLQDPLRLFAKPGPQYSLNGFTFEIDEYKVLVPKFREFILTE